MRGQLTASLSSKLDDLVDRHGAAAVLAAFESMVGDRVTAREYVFGAENALNTAHLKGNGAKGPAVPKGKYDGMVESGDDEWIAGGDNA